MYVCIYHCINYIYWRIKSYTLIQHSTKPIILIDFSLFSFVMKTEYTMFKWGTKKIHHFIMHLLNLFSFRKRKVSVIKIRFHLKIALIVVTIAAAILAAQLQHSAHGHLVHPPNGGPWGVRVRTVVTKDISLVKKS